MAKILKDTFDVGERATLISALNSFKHQMSERHALGDDDTGESIRFGYLQQCDRLLKAIIELENK